MWFFFFLVCSVFPTPSLNQGIYYSTWQRIRLCSVLTKRAVPVHQRAATWQNVHDLGRTCIWTNLLWKNYNRSPRWLEEGDSERICSGLCFMWKLSYNLPLVIHRIAWKKPHFCLANQVLNCMVWTSLLDLKFSNHSMYGVHRVMHLCFVFAHSNSS